MASSPDTQQWVGLLHGNLENTHNKLDLISDQDKLEDWSQEWDHVSFVSFSHITHPNSRFPKVIVVVID